MNSRKKGTGRPLLEREKLAVVRYCEEVKSEKPNLLMKEICDKASRIFDIHSTIAFKIVSEYQTTNSVRAPKKKGRCKINYKTDPAFYYVKEELARQIHEYHSRKQYFTLDDLLEYARDECEFTCSKSKLNKIIKSMGYKFKKFNNRKILIEQPHIIPKRIRFLRKYLQYLEGNYIFVFLDETWIYDYNKNMPSFTTTDSRIQKVKKMWLMGIDNFTPEMWVNSVNHCEQLIREDWRKLMGNTSVEDIPPVIIELGNSDEDSDSETDSD